MSITTGPTGDVAPAAMTGSDVAPVRTVTVRPRRGLTGVGVLVVTVPLAGLGLLVDLIGKDELNAGFSVAFLVCCVIAAGLARPRSLVAAVSLLPVLFASGAAAMAWLGGRVQGSRELVLEVAMTLALSAPLLFAGTLLAVVIAVMRAAHLGVGLAAARRRAG